MSYAENIKAIRKKSGLSQKDVAKALNTTYQQISRYETGINEMTISKLAEFCKCCHISADIVLGLSFDKEGDK